MKKEILIALLKSVILLVLVNLVARFFILRFDLTQDKRYTISEEAISASQKFSSPVIIDILLDGKLPAEFSKLKTETTLLLEQFASKNQNIKFDFVNPLEGDAPREQTLAELQQIGLTPANVTIEEDGKISQELVFPWAMVNFNNKTVKVPLLKNKLGTSNSTEKRINNSVQQLEYAFADAFTKLGVKEKKRVAVIKGNGELEDVYVADYLSTIREYYNIGAITLDSVATNPQKVYDQLKSFDLALVAKPTEAFTEEEKYVLDQFIVNGGKSIWLIDQVVMEMDSLFNEKGSAIAFKKQLNLEDFFFTYGVRINPTLVNDLYNTPIVLATGQANESQYNPLPWVYHPMVFSKNNHPINNNIEASRFQFSNTIDTLSNNYKKTILLQSSPLSKQESTPKSISLSILSQQPNKESYINKGNLPLAVLVEGEFSSVYANRVKPLKLEGEAKNGGANQILVVADGDIIKNQLKNGVPLPLGYDKWTNNTYGNKEFLVNSINYLLDDDGLINIRNKKVSIPILDIQKIAQEKLKWQLINIGVPMILILILGLGFYFFRLKKYTS